LSYIAPSVVSRYFQNATDKPSRTFTVPFTYLEPSGTVPVSRKVREAFMTSRALRVAKLLGATAFCYNIIVYKIFKLQEIIGMECGMGTEN